jgi:hypothetical protein
VQRERKQEDQKAGNGGEGEIHEGASQRRLRVTPEQRVNPPAGPGGRHEACAGKVGGVLAGPGEDHQSCGGSEQTQPLGAARAFSSADPPAGHRQLDGAEQDQRARAGVDARVGKREGIGVAGQGGGARPPRRERHGVRSAGACAQKERGSQGNGPGQQPHAREGDRVDEVRADRRPREQRVGRKANKRAGRAGNRDDPTRSGHSVIVNRQSSIVNLQSSFVLRPSSFVLRPSSFVLCPSSFVARRSYSSLLLTLFVCADGGSPCLVVTAGF